MEMKINYELSGVGWMTCGFEADGISVEFTVSYLTDVLADFLKAIGDLRDLFGEGAIPTKGTGCTWEGEPEQLHWNFRLKDDDLLSIQVDYQEDEGLENSKKCLVITEVPYDEFVELVINALDKLIKQHGLTGYVEMWHEHQFPLSSFLKLKHYVLHECPYPIKEGRSTLACDLSLLMKEME